MKLSSRPESAEVPLTQQIRSRVGLVSNALVLALAAHTAEAARIHQPDFGGTLRVQKIVDRATSEVDMQFMVSGRTQNLDLGETLFKLREDNLALTPEQRAVARGWRKSIDQDGNEYSLYDLCHTEAIGEIDVTSGTGSISVAGEGNGVNDGNRHLQMYRSHPTHDPAPDEVSTDDAFPTEAVFEPVLFDRIRNGKKIGSVTQPDSLSGCDSYIKEVTVLRNDAARQFEFIAFVKGAMQQNQNGLRYMIDIASNNTELRRRIPLINSDLLDYTINLPFPSTPPMDPTNGDTVTVRLLVEGSGLTGEWWEFQLNW